MKVYVSGGIAKRPLEEAKEHFARVANKLESLGYEVLNPFDVNCDHEGEFCLTGLPATPADEHSWECYLRYDLARMVLECDAIIMLDGWTDSRGAGLEWHTARALGFSVMFEAEL